MAVLRRQYDSVQALIEYEFPLVCKNARRWLPIDEAVALRDRRMVKVLHAAEVQTIKALHKAKRGALLQTMAKMDDFTFKVGCPDDAIDMYGGDSNIVWVRSHTGLCHIAMMSSHTIALQGDHTRHKCFL